MRRRGLGGIREVSWVVFFLREEAEELSCWEGGERERWSTRSCFSMARFHRRFFFGQYDFHWI